MKQETRSFRKPEARDRKPETRNSALQLISNL